MGPPVVMFCFVFCQKYWLPFGQYVRNSTLEHVKKYLACLSFPKGFCARGIEGLYNSHLWLCEKFIGQVDSTVPAEMELKHFSGERGREGGREGRRRGGRGNVEGAAETE